MYVQSCAPLFWQSRFYVLNGPTSQCHFTMYKCWNQKMSWHMLCWSKTFLHTKNQVSSSKIVNFNTKWGLSKRVKHIIPPIWFPPGTLSTQMILLPTYLPWILFSLTWFSQVAYPLAHNIPQLLFPLQLKHPTNNHPALYFPWYHILLTGNFYSTLFPLILSSLVLYTPWPMFSQYLIYPRKHSTWI